MDVLSDEPQILQALSVPKERKKGRAGKRDFRGRESKMWNPRPAPAFISGVPVI